MPSSPLVSFIIPVYNDPNGLRDTLESVTSQRDAPPFEILVVDNDSTDETPAVIDAFESEYPDVVSGYTETDVQSSYAARNTGLEHATGDIIAFLDADETVGKNWLETALEARNEQDVAYLGCNVRLTLESDTLVGRYNSRTGFPVQTYLQEENYAPTCALLVQREVFEDVGVFDSRLISGGDLEFGHRVAAAGYEQGYTGDATVTHPARTSLESVAKKNFRVGRGFCQKQRYYPDRYGQPGVPPQPSGSGSGDDGDESDAAATRVAFTILSVTMLACRGFGYYYEFLFGAE
ncbi:glycosyltransferase [Natrinema sp. LN54]|uniref:glycosyltransferase n=1 Tax=Natrinema sp. LN54 TaxID=3458705 RepID=UPI004037390E